MDKLFIIFLAVRVFCTYFVQTFFVPDEYWQSLEVAHKTVFGYGYLTWEWREGIRSSFYMLIFAGLYKLLRILNMDSAFMIIAVPRIFQAVLSSVGDLYTCKLAQRLYGNQSSRFTAFCILSSWFLFYCSSRTLINCAEMAVTSIGLYYFYKVGNLRFLIWAAVSCMLRPTAFLTWLPLYIWHMARLPRPSVPLLFLKTFLIGCGAVGIQVLMDFSFYGYWLLTPLNFFHWNWSRNISQFYGSHPWHWYLIQGIPAVLSGHTLPFLCGIKVKQLRPLYLLVFYVVACLSMVPHKEFRFLLPILPVMCIICGTTLNNFYRRQETRWISWGFIVLIISTNLLLAVYLSRWHKRGQLEVMDFIRDQIPITSNMKVLYLMPCHSTPYYSHLHSNITMDFLTCEPKPEDHIHHLEADNFFEKPSSTLQFILENDRPPTHLVLFDTLYSKIENGVSSYKECFQSFNNHVEENKKILVLCRTH